MSQRPILPKKPTVFLVEDDEAVCLSLAFALDLEGFSVEVCRTAESLLARDLPAGEAFVVLDHKLPGASGIQALNILRRRGVTLPAAIITTHPSAALRSAAAGAATPILDKPLLGETLIAAVREGLASHRRAFPIDGRQGQAPAVF